MMLIGYALHPLQTYRWVHFLKQDPLLDELAKTLPQLITRIHRPYVSPKLNCEQRVDLLIDHYQAVLRARLGDFIRKAALRPILLHEFTGKSGVPYQLTLSAIEPGQQDGEILLRLMSNGVRIYSASFFFTTCDQSYCIKIGGLHGILAIDNVMRIKRITRDLYGCRPKDLMVQVVRQIGECFGCNKLLLIGNENKLPPNETRVCKKSSDYDQLWKEMHAKRRSDGDYELPCCSMAAETEYSGWSPAEPAKRNKLVMSILSAIQGRLALEKSGSGYLAPGAFFQPEIEREAAR